MSEDMQKKFEEMFGIKGQSKSEDTLNTLKKMVQKTNEERDSEIQESLARSMLEGFNEILVKITFNILLESLDEDKRQSLKSQIYHNWKDQMQSQMASDNGIGNDSGLSDLFGVDNAMQKAFDAADNNIRNYLKIDENV